MEIWKKIPGYEGLYWVSSMGRVRSAKGVVKRLQQDEKGYPRLNLCKRGKVKCFRVHRLVAMAFLTGSREHLEVDHINRDRSDNRAAIRKKYPQELRDHVVSMRNSGMKFRQIASALRIDSKLALNLFHREVRV